MGVNELSQFEWTAMIVKIAVVVLAFLHIVPIMVWIERRGSALMQNRSDPIVWVLWAYFNL